MGYNAIVPIVFYPWPFALDFMRFWAPRKGYDSAILGYLLLHAVGVVVQNLAWAHLLQDVGVPDEHLQIVVEAHEVL